MRQLVMKCIIFNFPRWIIFVLVLLSTQVDSFSSSLHYFVFGGIANSTEDAISTTAFKDYQLYTLLFSGEVSKQVSSDFEVKSGTTIKHKLSDGFMFKHRLNYFSIPIAIGYKAPYNFGIDLGASGNFLIVENRGYKIVYQCDNPSLPAAIVPPIGNNNVNCSDREMKVDVNETYLKHKPVYLDAFININYSYKIFGIENTFRATCTVGITKFRNLEHVNFNPLYRDEAIQFNHKSEKDIEIGLSYGVGFDFR